MPQISIWNKSVPFWNWHFNLLGCKMHWIICTLELIFTLIVNNQNFDLVLRNMLLLETCFFCLKCNFKIWTLLFFNQSLWRFVDKRILHYRSSKYHISVTIKPNVLDHFHHLWLITTIFGEYKQNNGNEELSWSKFIFKMGLGFFNHPVYWVGKWWVAQFLPICIAGELTFCFPKQKLQYLPQIHDHSCWG